MRSSTAGGAPRMNNPLVSIVVPTRNRAELLERAVRSVQAQTVQNWELIVVDDASVDQTPQVLDRLAADDARIRHCRSARPLGASAARNRGAAAARGDLLAFLDDDATWAALKLERQLPAFASDPAADVVFCTLLYHDQQGGVRSVGFRGIAHADPRRTLLRSNTLDTSCAVVRRSTFEAAGGFDEELPRLQDWDLWVRLARSARFAFVDEPLVTGWFTAGSISTNSAALVAACSRLVAKLESDPATTRGELGDWSYALGHTLMIGGAPQAGMQRLLRAVGLKPWPPQRLVMALAAVAGPRTYQLIAQTHSRVTQRE